MAGSIFKKRKVTSPIVSDDVNALYRLLLGRKADAQGLAYFSSLIEDQGAAVADVASMLIRSDEFALKHGAGHVPVEIQLDGYVMFARPSDRDIGGAIAKGGAYEPHVTSVVKRELRAGNSFLDVGANIGYFTMLAAHLVGKEGRVIAIEPLDKNVQLIYRCIARNAFCNVEVFPFGASDCARLVPMVTDPETSNALVQTVASEKISSTFAATRTLDWMCAGVDKIDLIKMDIEGHEVFAWRGGQQMLQRCRPRIITEFHPLAMRENAGIDCGEYLALLFGYSKVVNVITTPETLVACFTHEEVMVQWKKGDLRHGGKGSSHLDLFVAPIH